MKCQPMLLVSLFAISLSTLAVADQGHHEALSAEQLGSVSFPTSCAANVQKPFERGVALLHSFWYEEAEKQFAEVAKNDSHCAMAHWGIAMSLYHQLWERPGGDDLERGAAELAKAQALAAKATPREREYIAALGKFYSDGKQDHLARAAAYSAAMGKLYRDHPSDYEAGAFFALSLLAAEPPHDATLANRKEAIPLLNELFRKNPSHPGVAHYLIHSCDRPQLAAQGLDAARRYAQIAPSSPHALHMPSHIFARLGLWDEDIKSNLASVKATRETVAMHMAGGGHQVHAMDFLQYAYLQTGQEDAAAKLIDEIQKMSIDSHDMMAYLVDYGRAQFPATYALEMRHWSEAAALKPARDATPMNRAITDAARAVGAGHLGDAAATEKAERDFEADLAAVKKSNTAYTAITLEIPHDVVLAWQEFAKEDTAEALRLIRSAADRQDAAGDKGAGTPAREMLADMLIELKRPQEALAEYETVLKYNPNRFNAIYGAAQAAELAQHQERANGYYAQLVKLCGPDTRSSRPELATARAKTLVARK